MLCLELGSEGVNMELSQKQEGSSQSLSIVTVKRTSTERTFTPPLSLLWNIFSTSFPKCLGLGHQENPRHLSHLDLPGTYPWPHHVGLRSLRRLAAERKSSGLKQPERSERRDERRYFGTKKSATRPCLVQVVLGPTP